MITFAHIINPVKSKEGSNLAFVQPVTFETMRRAKCYVDENVGVELLSAQYSEDHHIIPSYFRTTVDLERSAIDLADFKVRRKLPLLRDIIDRLYDSSDADYLIYTNVDIALMPYFYQTVKQIIENGHDAFVINRRTISDIYTGVKDIPSMYAEIGQAHRGWDCFVFQRADYPKYDLGDVLVGVPRVGLVLIANMVAHSTNFLELRHEHLTFHLGNDRRWGGRKLEDYARHNTKEAMRVTHKLEDTVRPFPSDSPPGSFLFYHRNKLIGTVYEFLVSRLYLPARLGRPLSGVAGLFYPRR